MRMPVWCLLPVCAAIAQETPSADSSSPQASWCDGQVALVAMDLSMGTVDFSPAPFERIAIHKPLVDLLSGFFDREVTLLPAREADVPEECRGMVVEAQLDFYRHKRLLMLEGGRAGIILSFFAPGSAEPDFKLVARKSSPWHLGSTVPSVHVEKAVQAVADDFRLQLESMEGVYGKAVTECDRRLFMQRFVLDSRTVGFPLTGRHMMVLNGMVLRALQRATGREVYGVGARGLKQVEQCGGSLVVPVIEEYVLTGKGRSGGVRARLVVRRYERAGGEAGATIAARRDIKVRRDPLSFATVEKVVGACCDELERIWDEKKDVHVTESSP